MARFEEPPARGSILSTSQEISGGETHQAYATAAEARLMGSQHVRARHTGWEDAATAKEAAPPLPYELAKALEAEVREVQEIYARILGRAHALRNHLGAIRDGQIGVERVLSELEQILEQDHLRAANRVSETRERSGA